MNIGEEITIGRMGQQPMHISDINVNPEHAILRKTGDNLYQIEDAGSTSGVFVFGMRVKRKTVNEDTPIQLGKFVTSVKQLLQDSFTVDLETVWNEYELEKRKWDRKAMVVNYLRILPSILTMLLSTLLGLSLDPQTRTILTLVLTVIVLVVSIVIGERIMAKKELRMQEMNSEMRQKYRCPHCQRPLPLTAYKILKDNTYCPNCSFPLP